MRFLFRRKQPKAALAQAIEYRKTGKLERAQRTVSDALEQAPENVALLVEAGRIAFARHDWASAITYFMRACHNDLGQARPGLILKIAAAYRHLNLFGAADSATKLVLDHDPFDQRALTEYAAIATKREDWPAAAARWVRLAESQAAKLISATFPQNAKSEAVLIEFGKFAFLRQDWTSALAYFLRSCGNDLSKASRDTVLKIAAAYRRTENFAEAESAVDQVLQFNPIQPDALREKAEIATAREDWPVAIARWSRLAEVSKRRNDQELAANRLLRVYALQHDGTAVERILHDQIGHDETPILKEIFGSDKWQTELVPKIAGGHIVAAKIHRTGGQAVFEKIRFNDTSARRERLFNSTFNQQMLDKGVSAPKFYGSIESSACISLFYDAIVPQRVDFNEETVQEIIHNITTLSQVRSDSNLQELHGLGAENDQTKPSPKAFAQVSRELKSNPRRGLATLRGATHRLQRLDTNLRGRFGGFYRMVDERSDRFEEIFAKLPNCLNHYDINRTNALRCRERKKIFLIDWELGDLGPLGYDFGYFLATASTPFRRVLSLFDTEIAKNIGATQAEKDAILFSIVFHYVLCSPITSAVWISAKPDESVIPAQKYIAERLAA